MLVVLEQEPQDNNNNNFLFLFALGVQFANGRATYRSNLQSPISNVQT